MRTRVKICGFTEVETAVTAAKLGVDAIGLVFYPASPRHVTIEQAAAIASAMPAFVAVVALFVDADPNYIEQVLDQVAIDCIQFHGNESAEACRRHQKPYLKAIRMQADTDLAALQTIYHDAAGLLLDAYHPGIQGGTGSSFDWNLIPPDCDLPIILAGGLTPDNIEQAIQKVKPYAVDVSSGVEAGKGIKNVAKMAAFIRKTNQATENYD